MASKNRKKLSEELQIPLENASRLLIEKEKAIARSEVRYHTKALSGLLDSMAQTDSDFSEAIVRETIKFLLARHGSTDMFDDVGAHIETLSETFMDRALVDSFRDEY
jgi:hypothetical protein